MMTNKKGKKLDVKTILILFLSILGSLILAASIVVGVISFNGDSTTSNDNIIELTSQSGSIALLSDEQQKNLLNDVHKVLEENGIKITDYSILQGEGSGFGAKLQFVSSSSLSALQQVCNNTEVNQKLQQLSYFAQNNDTPILSSHSREYMPYYEHIWRAAVAIAVVLVVWFGYMAIRFRLGMSVTAIIMLVLDGLAMLSVVALTRIPVGISLMGSLVVTLLFSAMCSTILFAKMYQNFKNPNWQNKSLATAITDTTMQNRKLILLFAAIIGIILGGTAIVAGAFAKYAADLFGFALSTFLGLAISVVNALYFTPVLFYSIQNAFDDGKRKKGKKVYLAGKDLFEQTEDTKVDEQKEIVEETTTVIEE